MARVKLAECLVVDFLFLTFFVDESLLKIFAESERITLCTIKPHKISSRGNAVGEQDFNKDLQDSKVDDVWRTLEEDGRYVGPLNGVLQAALLPSISKAIYGVQYNFIPTN